MRITTHAATALCSLLVLGCTPGTPSNPAPTSTGTTGTTTSTGTSGTVVVPRETDPSVASRPLPLWQLAPGYLFGMPALAATLDASAMAQFTASIDGTATPCKWDAVETASGDTRARFTLTNPPTTTNAELIFRSPSGTIKLATLVDRFDANAKAVMTTEVNARSTGGLLVARAMVKSGGKPIKSYTSAEFQAVVNSPRTVEVETSLKAALSASNNKGQDTWTLPAVTSVTASVATDLGVSLKLGGSVSLGSGITL